MKLSTSNVLLFMVGAITGSVCTYFVMKPKYEEQIERERESLQEAYERYEKRPKVQSVTVNCGGDGGFSDEIQTIIEDGKPELSTLVREKGYKTDYASMYVPEKRVKKERVKKNKPVEVKDEEQFPYVVSPEEFGEKQDDKGEDYEKITLHYYSDGVLTDDLNEVVEDVDGSVGFDSLNHFGEYEDDTVFVRNDKLKADYEILKELSKFSELHGGPRGSEG